MSHRSPTPAISLVPQPADPLAGLPPDAQRRIRLFLEASKAVNNPEFRGAVLLSLIIYVDDDLLTEAIDDALHSIHAVSGGLV